MTKVVPKADGESSDIHQVISVDPKGYVPDFIKKFIAKSQGENLMHLVEYIKNGTLPPQI